MSRARRRGALLAVWLVLAALLGVIAAVEYHERGQPPAPPAADDRRLLPAAVDAWDAVEVADGGQVHRFERDAGGAWFYHGVHTGVERPHHHAVEPALTERIADTLAAFARTRVEREVPLQGTGEAYGVATPRVVVLVYGRGRSEPLAQYAIGHVAPDTVSRYVLRVGSPVVVTIPGYQVDNLLALVRAVERAGTRAHRHR